jgi:hypothetical protein
MFLRSGAGQNRERRVVDPYHSFLPQRNLDRNCDRPLECVPERAGDSVHGAIAQIVMVEWGRNGIRVHIQKMASAAARKRWMEWAHLPAGYWYSSMPLLLGTTVQKPVARS